LVKIFSIEIRVYRYLLGSTTHKSGGIHQLFHLLVDRREVSALFYPAKQSVTASRVPDALIGIANKELLDLDTDRIQNTDPDPAVNITV
jgi:hypothetical protein